MKSRYVRKHNNSAVEHIERSPNVPMAKSPRRREGGSGSSVAWYGKNLSAWKSMLRACRILKPIVFVGEQVLSLHEVKRMGVGDPSSLFVIG